MATCMPVSDAVIAAVQLPNRAGQNFIARLPVAISAPWVWGWIVLALGFAGCHPGPMHRSAALNESSDVAVLNQEVGALATDEWTDEFSTPGQVARSRDGREPADQEASPLDASDPKPGRVVSQTPPAATSATADPDTDTVPMEATAAIVSESIVDPVRTASHIEPEAPESAEEAIEGPVNAPAEERIAGPAEELADPPTTGLAKESAEELAEEPLRELVNEDVESLLAKTTTECGLENARQAASAEPVEESGFFHNIFLDAATAADPLERRSTKPGYSGMRRLFHHPDAKARIRSHSPFSRPFQRQPRDE